MEAKDHEPILKASARARSLDSFPLGGRKYPHSDDRILPPKHFGIGLDLNYHARAKKMGLIKK
jgi:hypothetical protein